MRSLRTRNQRAERDRRAQAKTPDRGLDSGRFRVMIVAHRPRYRARALRAANGPGWLVTALLNRQDPIGMLHQKLAHVLVISVDTVTNRNIGYLRAAQPLRSEGLRVIGIFGEQTEADSLQEQCDSVVVAPWRTADLRRNLSLIAVQHGFAPAVEGRDDDKDVDSDDA